jgi:Ser/Thr protein kinase RdoA (MazF antagonist)
MNPAAGGLIPADLHGGNLLVEPDRKSFTVLDFDGSSGLVRMDIAMNVLDMSVLYPGADKMPLPGAPGHYLAGYRRTATHSGRPRSTFPEASGTGLYLRLPFV